jgi:hypothetical protein
VVRANGTGFCRTQRFSKAAARDRLLWVHDRRFTTATPERQLSCSASDAFRPEADLREATPAHKRQGLLGAMLVTRIAAEHYLSSSHPRMFKVTVGSEEGIVLAGSVISSFSSRVSRFSPHTCSSRS